MSTCPISGYGSGFGSPSKNKNYYIVDVILKSIINQRSSTRPNLLELKSHLFLVILLICTVNLCVRVLISTLTQRFTVRINKATNTEDSGIPETYTKAYIDALC
jgi:hypothetical protein